MSGVYRKQNTDSTQPLIQQPKPKPNWFVRTFCCCFISTESPGTTTPTTTATDPAHQFTAASGSTPNSPINDSKTSTVVGQTAQSTAGGWATAFQPIDNYSSDDEK